jgi:iron(III) transport system permease protein
MILRHGVRWSRTVVLGSSFVVFLVCCILPVVCMTGWVAGSVRSDPAAILSALVLDARQQALFLNSVALGVGTALGATCLGAPLGVVLAYGGLPYGAVWRLALAVPILFPPYIVALAWPWASGVLGAIAVLSLVFYPLSMLATEAAVRRVEPHLEEAALLVASPRRVWCRVTLRLAAPGIGAAALVVFVLAVSEFGVPSLLDARVFSTEVFTAFAALYDFGRATLLSVPLLLVSLAAAGTAAALVTATPIVTRRGGVGGNRPLSLTRWRGPLLAVAVAVLAVGLLAPIVLLVYEARRVTSLAEVLQGSGDAALGSLRLAFVSAVIVTATAVGLGYARGRAVRRPWLSDLAFIGAFATPAAVLGIGLIAFWNREGIAGTVYGTQAMIVLAYVARSLPVAALMFGAAVRQTPVSHEEAAWIAGSGWLRSLGRIVLPQMQPALLATFGVAFVLAFGELGASLLVAPPGESTLPIRIYTLIANTPASYVATLALFQLAVVLCPVALVGVGLLLRRAR